MTTNLNHLPLFNSLTKTVSYINSTPVLHANVEVLADLVAHHKYNGHPDEECKYDSAMRGDLEAYYYTCQDIQERVENLRDLILETPLLDDRLTAACREYNVLLNRYGY